MTLSSPDAPPLVIKRPVTLFPLIRHFSAPLSPRLARFPITGNQITAISLVVGLSGNWFIAEGDFLPTLIGAGLFFLCYVLDNCDGEVARIKKQDSEFGHKFDTMVDWLVNSSFFAALGIGVAGRFDNDLWLWMGMIAAAGGTINYGICLFLDARDKADAEAGAAGGADENGESLRKPEGLSDWVLYIFRELSRADFCFIVLALALFDVTWVLLPAGAIGSQVYWIMQFFQGARDFHA